MAALSGNAGREMALGQTPAESEHVMKSTELNTDNSYGSNPGYPFTFLDAPGNLWDSLKWWQRPLAIFAFIVIGGMVVSYLAGWK